MIKKEITMEDGKTYLVGFKEIGTVDIGIECHILQKGMLLDRSLFHTLRLKGMSVDYKQMAQNTIYKYNLENERRDRLMTERW